MFKYNENYVSKEEGKYYSCKWIESGLVFFAYKLTMCCYCGHEGGGHVKIRENYRGQDIDWSRIFWLKDQFRKFYKKGKIHTNCVGCSSLQEDNWGENKENSITNLYISHWTQCNSRCTYCYATQNPEEFKYPQLYSVLPQIKNMLKDNILKRGGSVHFGGGEPTLLNEFEELIELLLDYKFYDLRIHTSGIKYSPILERGIREGRLNVVVSTDAGCAETYKKIKQVDCFDKVRENIKKYAQAQVDANLQVAPDRVMMGKFMVSSKYIIIPGTNDTISELESWISANEEEGLKTTVLDLEENWYKENKDNISKHIYDLVEYAKKRSTELHTNFELYERLESMIKEKKPNLFEKLFNKLSR